MKLFTSKCTNWKWSPFWQPSMSISLPEFLRPLKGLRVLFWGWSWRLSALREIFRISVILALGQGLLSTVRHQHNSGGGGHSGTCPQMNLSALKASRSFSDIFRVDATSAAALTGGCFCCIAACMNGFWLVGGAVEVWAVCNKEHLSILALVEA